MQACGRLPGLLLYCEKRIYFVSACLRLTCFPALKRDIFKPHKIPFMKTAPNDFSATVTRPFNTWADKRLAAETKSIATAMLKNPGFPSPQPTVAAFSTSVNAFIDQLAKAGTRDVNAVAAKNARRRELILSCIALSNSVAQTANGNRELLESTLMPMRKTPQAVVIKNPQNFRIGNGINPGELILKINGMRANSFIFEYTQDPPTEASVWTRTSCSTTRCTVKGLEAGKKYWFRVAAVGSKGQLVWGETILSPFVQ